MRHEVKLKKDASFHNIRFNLSYTLKKKEEYKNEISRLEEKNYGYWLVRIATECSLLLDQFMEIVWTKVGDLDKKKPYIYFPVFYDLDGFEKRIDRLGVGKIRNDFPDLYELIKTYQPIGDMQHWLYRQHHVASERHSDPQRVYNFKRKGIKIFSEFLKGEEVKFSVSSGGKTEFVHVRRWGIPNTAPPEVIIDGKQEAVEFIEACISGTDKLIKDMMHCLEKDIQ